MSNPDTMITVSNKRIACDGGGDELGHPKTWLDMGMDTKVVCKYCGQGFRLDPEAQPTGH